MIELKNVSKKYNGVFVLKNINLSFPQYGIVMIYGPSGCGKTTLLNIISSLCDFEGNVSFNGKSFKNMKEEDKDRLRNSKIGFVFQDYKLYEHETVKNNIMLSLNIKSDDKEEIKYRRVRDLLNVVGLAHKSEEKVSNLSGGEKQRIAIARAISNSPSIVLADEPTGNLDAKNSKIVMDLLERVSKSSLVVMVSHDMDLTKEYADQIIYLKDGEVEKVEYNNHNHHVDRLPLLHITQKEKKARLPFSFSIRHVFNQLKRRKWRTLLVLISTSLSLIGVGLGTVLTDLISTNMYKSYSSIIDTNKVIVKNKEDVVSNKIYTVNEEIINRFKENNENDVSYVGVHYLNDFNTFIGSTFSLSNGKTIPDYSIKHVNEFTRVDELKSIVYPVNVTSIMENQVILGLSNPLLVEICYQLQILRNIESLSAYLRKNTLYLTIDVENPNWQYYRSFTLEVVGFSLTKTNMLIHSNPRWNEFVLESLCGLPTTNVAFLPSNNPYDLHKAYYLEFKKNRDSFLKKIKFDKTNQDYIAEVLNSNYYSLRDINESPKDAKRVMLFTSNKKDNVDGFIGKHLYDLSPDIHSLIYGSKASYMMYPENLMMGFARQSYLYFDNSSGQEVIDVTSYIKYEESNNVNIPSNVISGHFTKSFTSGLSFNPEYKLVKGRKPNNYSEIVLSEQIINQLQIYNPLNKKINFAFPIKEELLPNGYLSRKYVTTYLEIVGISSSSRLEISSDEEWPIIFFQSMVGVSSFNLTIDAIALQIDDNQENEIISKVERAFPHLEATCPISSVKESVDKVCQYIEIILLILSFSSILIAGLLLAMCNYLHYNEIKKDIGLSRCLGIGKKESGKFIYFHSFSLSISAFIVSSIELLVICFVVSKSMEDIFYIESSFYFNPLALLYMFTLAVTIALFSSLIIKKKVNKLNPLDCLR